MEVNLNNFQLKEILNSSQTQRTLFLLGTIKEQEGEAIAILSPKVHDCTHLAFHNIVTIFTNDIYARFTVELETQFDIQFIYPITEKHKKKYQRKTYLIEKQSGQDYLKKKDQLLKAQLSHIQWVTNIIEGKTEVDRVLYKCPEFLICQDFKWTDIKDLNSMHLSIIYTDPSLYSLRELRAEHIPLLEKAQICLKDVLQNKLGTSISQCRVYFHYPPTFYQLHTHVSSLSLESMSCRVQRSHDFFLVLQNLKMKGDYYKDVTLNNFTEK